MSPDDDKTQAVIVLSKATVINHYRIIEKIGAGGMGEVYLAEDTSLNRKVALKFLSSHLCQDADCRARFKREAQAAAKLDHPNIVTVHEVGEFQGRPFFAMQHIEGRSLREHVSGRELSILQVLEIGIQIADGLHAAHEKGVTHRDIKPSNILIDSHGRARILDFGLASVAGTDQLTKTGSTLGTIGYMSPEQVRGEAVDHRTDIFSLGVVLYELITGRQPFKGDNDAATSRNILDINPEPLARYKAGVSEELQRVIGKALAKDKGTRYLHADELAADLRQQLSPSGSHQAARSRRTRVILIAVAILLLSIVAVAFKPWQYLDRSSKQSATETNRVVIVPFRNQTGDSSLDALGKMVADWTTQSLTQSGIAEVIPSDVVVALDPGQEVNGIAEATGANLIVTGSYYKVVDTIQFQAQVLDDKAGLLQAIAPVRVQTARVMDGVESVRQLVLGGVAILLNERLEGMQVQAVSPPRYDAYQEYIQGREHHTESNWGESFGHFMKAYTLDTSFLASLLGACGASSNSERYAVADSLARYLEARRSRLNTIQQLHLDGLRYALSADHSKALIAARQAAKLAPGSTYAYQWGFRAFAANRPEECIEALRTMDPQKGWARGWFQYWYLLTLSLHLLGEHEQELAEAKEAQRLYPESPNPLTYKIRALAAMGKVGEIRRVLNESAAIPVNAGLAPPVHFHRAGMELRAHGYEDSAMTFLNLAVNACRSASLVDSNSRAALAEYLYCARRWRESQAIYEELARKSPENVDYRGYLGVLAARQGDLGQARAHSEWLKNLHASYLFGADAYWRALIAAVLGDSVQAVELLREAIKKGNAYSWEDHVCFDFESMKNYPPYVELMQMKR